MEKYLKIYKGDTQPREDENMDFNVGDEEHFQIFIYCLWKAKYDLTQAQAEFLHGEKNEPVSVKSVGPFIPFHQEYYQHSMVSI